MALAGLAFVLGALVSLATSFVLVIRLERIGERFGFSEALLGMLAALAADAPEITAVDHSSRQDQRPSAQVWSSGRTVFNLAALLGLGAVVAGTLLFTGGWCCSWRCWQCGGHCMSLLVGGRVRSSGLGLGLALECWCLCVALGRQT